MYRDYYTEITEFLEIDHAYCQYDDEDYDDVRFLDVTNSRDSSSIGALQALCVVKGLGTDKMFFKPYESIKRAEFAKMLLKTMYL